MSSMRSPRDVKAEHEKAVSEMGKLVEEAQNKGIEFPIEHDFQLYCRLSTIKDVLEWVNPLLVQTDPNGRNRIEQLMGDSNYFAAGPVDAEMLRRRV